VPARNTVLAFLFFSAPVALSGPSMAEVTISDLRALGLSTEFVQMAQEAKLGFVPMLMSQLGPVVQDGAITRESVDLLTRIDSSGQAASGMARYLRYDLDGDGTVSREEINQIAAILGDDEKRMMDRLVEDADKTGDGNLTLAEIYATVRELSRAGDGGRRLFLDDVLKSDLDGDGRTTTEELLAVVSTIQTAAFEPDGFVADQSGPPTWNCAPPKPEGTAELVVVSSYRGAALTNIAVAGQDQTATAVRLNIEPGTTPIYVFAASLMPVVWHVEGDLTRIQRIVVQSASVDQGPGAGVVGIDKGRVSFVPANSCIEPFYRNSGDVEDISWKWSVSALEKHLGRRVSSVVSEYQLPNAAIPSGAMTTTDPDYDAPTKNSDGTLSIVVDLNSPKIMMAKKFPNGLVETNVTAVVSPQPVEAYQILPEEAGLAVLLGQGALERISLRTTKLRGSAYLIVKPIKRLPNGLRSEKFVLRRGVAMPEVVPEGYSVYDEETGACLSQTTSSCR
jgi:EF hand